MKLLFSGRRIDVEATLLELRQLPEIESVSLEGVPQAPSILRRHTQRQFELYDVVVSIALSIASSGAYEGIKAAILAMARKRNIRVGDANEEGGDRT
jgi:hypothetical protein